MDEAKTPHSVDHITSNKLSEDIRRWERWINKHPDSFMSVHRGSDRKQLEIGAADVIRKLSLKKGERILDAGCGSAIFLSEILKHIPVNAVGIDFSAAHIRFAKQNISDIHFLVTSIENLPFSSSYFDKILSYSVFHCLEDWKKGLNEFLRVSKPGGKILIGDVPSGRHRYRMYLNSLGSLLLALKSIKKLREKWNYLEEEIPWNWIDLREVKEYVESKGFSCTILSQPKHRQFESITYHYRFDLLIEK
ncbi:MAG TPA: methyltransferase domain-containing protein [Thermodesulfobacteriota bacterium]|nr:methyltransferase domain-containing protein [Thermodesulfobacteriota bacterium]